MYISVRYTYTFKKDNESSYKHCNADTMFKKATLEKDSKNVFVTYLSIKV